MIVCLRSFNAFINDLGGPRKQIHRKSWDRNKACSQWYWETQFNFLTVKTTYSFLTKGRMVLTSIHFCLASTCVWNVLTFWSNLDQRNEEKNLLRSVSSLWFQGEDNVYLWFDVIPIPLWKTTLCPCSPIMHFCCSTPAAGSHKTPALSQMVDHKNHRKLFRTSLQTTEPVEMLPIFNHFVFICTVAWSQQTGKRSTHLTLCKFSESMSNWHCAHETE